MGLQLGDIFIGNFPITQSFGARPDLYSARYNLRGHNGTDFGVPSLTLILAAADGLVSEIGFDAGGYGNYVKVVHNGFLTLYAHLHDIIVQKGDHVVSGQLIAHSNNTGFSDAPHLHFGVAPCDAAGIKTQTDNGYSGYVDPMGALCSWTVKNLSAPVVPNAISDPQTIPVLSTDFVNLRSKSSSNDVILAYLLAHGLNDALVRLGRAAIDTTLSPQDAQAGQDMALFVGEILQENQDLKVKLSEATPPTSQADVSVALDKVTEAVSNMSEAKKASFLGNLFGNLKAYIFTQG